MNGRIGLRCNNTHTQNPPQQSLLWFHLNAAVGGHATNGRPPGGGGNGPSGSSSPGRNGGGGNGGRNGGGRPLQPPLTRARDAFAPEELVGKVDRLFFFGDLNYRLELPREDVEVRVCVCCFVCGWVW